MDQMINACCLDAFVRRFVSYKINQNLISKSVVYERLLKMKPVTMTHSSYLIKGL